MCGVIPIMVGGMALSAIASIKGGADQKSAANQAAKDTLAFAEEQASDVRQRAAMAAGDIAAQGAQVAASQRAVIGGSNVSGGTTNGKVIESAIAAGRDEAMVKANAAREAFGLKRQAYREASALKKQGRSAIVNGILGAGGGILGGAGQIAAYQGRYRGPTTGGTGGVT